MAEAQKCMPVISISPADDEKEEQKYDDDNDDDDNVASASSEGGKKRGAGPQMSRLKDDVDCVFRRSCEPFIERGALSRIHYAVRQLLDSNAGPFIFDYFRDHMLPSGMKILCQLMETLASESKNPDRFVSAFAMIWRRFFRGILPAIDEIFFRVKTKSDQSIRRTSMTSFRDEVFVRYYDKLLQTDVIVMDSPDFKTIKNMLLILQSIPGACEGKSRVELVAVTLIPNFTGCTSVNEKKAEKQTRMSTESFLTEIFNIEERRGSRPLLPQPKHLETLRQLVVSAGKRKK